MPPADLCFAYVTFYFKMSPLSFDNGWTDRNADCCGNTVDENIPTAKNLVSFGPVTPEVLWLICMAGDCTVLFKDHPLGGSSIASL